MDRKQRTILNEARAVLKNPALRWEDILTLTPALPGERLVELKTSGKWIAVKTTSDRRK